jgi:hypothetical protein
MRNQQRFRELDAELGEALKGLDHLVAELTNASLARFVQLQATYASGLLHAYGNALAAIPGSLKAGGPPAAVVMPSPGAAPAAAASPATAGAGGAGASPATAASHGRGSVSGGIASGSLASFTSASPAPAAGGGAAGAGGFITDPKALFADAPESSAPPAASAAAPAVASASHADHSEFAGDGGSGGASMASFLGGSAAATVPPALSVESLHAATTSAGGDPAAVPASSAAGGNPFASPSATGPTAAERAERPHVAASSNPFADSDDFTGPPPAPAE